MVTDTLIPKGYQQTDAGVIPDDWEVKELGTIAHFENGKAHENYISDDGDYIVINSKFISSEGGVFKYSNRNFSPISVGDIAFVMSDIPNGKALAKCYLVKRDNKFALNQRICSLRAAEVDNVFLFYTLNRNRYFLQFDNGVSQTNLRRGDVLKCPLTIPSTKTEQATIATALSDANALIVSLEKLIAKKKAIKQGTMQQLFAPKEHWEEKTIFQIADNKKELFDDGDWIEAEHITDKGIRLIQTGNIGIGTFVEKETRKYIFKESFYKLGCKELKVGDLLICRLAEPAGRSCVLPFIGEEKVITSVDVTIFRPREELANRVFLSNMFSTSVWFKAISELCGGTTHKRISRSALGRIKIFLPRIEEQTAIATILSDMDAEIEELEQKLDKYKMIKQGMMQELLTGRTRLI